MSDLLTRRAFLATAILTPTALAAGEALAGGVDPPMAFVTADLESKVVVVNLASRIVVGAIRTRVPGPRSIERAGAWLVVAHSEHGVLTLIDPATRRVVGEVDRLDEPRYVAAHPKVGRIAYVSDSGLGEIAIVDLQARRVVGRIDVDGAARHITISPDGTQLWTALGSKAERIAVVDLASPRVLGRVRHLQAADHAHDVVFTPDGEQVWVTSGTRRRVVVHDARSRRPVFSVAADAAPQHVAMLGRRVFVASGDDGTLRTHDRRGALLQTRRTPIGSFNVVAASGEVATPSLSAGTLAHPVTRVAGGGHPSVLRVADAAHDACIVSGGS